MIQIRVAAVASLAAALLLAGCAKSEDQTRVDNVVPPPVVDADGFETFIGPGELYALLASDEDVVLVDVRSPAEYEAGHIAGAINLPGKSLRTPKAKPGEGDSQYIFRTASGDLDVARYEQILGDAGISRDNTVIVYGNHGGKGDGSIPAMLLDWLGQEEVRFLDGVGLSEWQAAGLPVVQERVQREPTQYVAAARDGFVWNLDDVERHVGTGEVVFYDTRSADEFHGVELRSNSRGGHIPGAIFADYSDLLDEDKTVLDRATVEAYFASKGLPEAREAGKPIVLYCQTSTRVSLPYLLLRELGYDNVVVYDASWHEYGNTDSTKIASAR
jgi:thiosulfate/3-mercaptopyruvate sulfurtransferase